MSAFAVSLLSFIAAAGLTSLLWRKLTYGFDPVRRRLLTSTASSKSKEDHERGGWTSLFRGWFQESFRMLTRAFGVAEQVRRVNLRSQLQQTGMIGLVGVVAAASFFAAYRSNWIAVWPLFMRLAGSGLSAWCGGWLTARLWLTRYARHRVEEVNSGLINALDLWALCLGGGMSFYSALVKVTQDPELTTPVLHQELQLTLHEMLAGCPREEALRHLVRRCGDSTDVRVLVSHIVQSERLGGSLEQMLRSYADSLRFKRRQDSLELIQKLPVKLAFPLVCCLFPALLIIIIGPPALQLITALASF